MIKLNVRSNFFVLLLVISAGILQPNFAVASVPLSCVANAAVPPTARAEGVSELAGDIVVDCTGGVPTAGGVNIPPVNISVFTNTAITSRVFNSSGWSEVLLLLDEAGFGANPTQAPCHTDNGICVNKGNGEGAADGISPNYYVGQGSGTNVNVFQGIVSGNSVTFFGVPFDPSGVWHRTMRITNLRVNASAVAPGAGGTPGIVQALISASGFSISNPTLVIGFVQNGLKVSVTPTLASAVRQCEAQQNLKIATLRFSELFPTAFKKRNILTSDFLPTVIGLQNSPGTIYNVESGLFNSNWTGNTASRGNLKYAGLAAWGSRLKAAFHNVPAGVTIYVDTQGTNTVSGAVDAVQLTEPEAGSFYAVPPTSGGPAGAAVVDIVNGEGSAVWEITEANSLASGAMDFGVYASYGAEAAVRPAAGNITVSGSFGPISVTSDVLTLSIPRFVDTSTAAGILEIAACPAPDITLTAAARQGALTKKAVIGSVQPGGAYSLNASAKITISGSTKVWDLKNIAKTSQASQKITLRFVLNNKALKNAIRLALAKKKAVTATITVVATDSLGVQNTKTAAIKINK